MNIQAIMGTYAYERFVHLFMIFCFRDRKEHLKDWVVSARRGIELLLSAKCISSETIYDWAFGDYEDNLERLTEGIREDINYMYKELPEVGDFSFVNFRSFCSDYFLKASAILSKERCFSCEDAYVIITALLHEYPLL